MCRIILICISDMIIDVQHVFKANFYKTQHNLQPMKIRTDGKIKDIKSVWFENNTLKMIDQTLLPHKLRIIEIKRFEDVVSAIKNMIVRGAPSIGAAAAYGIALARISGLNLEKSEKELKKARPTAYDLFYAVDWMLGRINEGEDAVKASIFYSDMIVEKCRKIGQFGESLIKDGDKILTHCNAGALATVDYGTALSPMRFANNSGKKIFVYVDETRPRLQGAKLTAWELANEGIEHAVIADNAAGFFMKNREIDLVITGADRITRNGDAANKIGTYEKAVLAKENKVPFYIAAPVSTFDLNCLEIPIEFRDENEVLYIEGIKICKSRALNPAFDVTPARYITGFITEFGIFKPEDVLLLKISNAFATKLNIGIA